DLINEVTEKYGGEVKKYRDFADSLKDKTTPDGKVVAKGRYSQLKEMADPEVDKIKQLPLSQVTDEDLGQTLTLAIRSVRDIPRALQQSLSGVDRLMKQKPPDYKAISDSVKENMDTVAQMLKQLVGDFTK